MTTNALVVDARTYFAAYERAFEKTDYPGFLAKFTLEDLEHRNGLVCYLTPDHQCGMGVYVEDAKVYAFGLFNVGNIPGAGYSLIEYVVRHNNVRYLDAFEGVLTEMYKTLGFESYEVVEFDDQYAHDWNYERDGRPAVHFMRRS